MIDLVYIDDEPALLRAMTLMLEACGLSVAAFESPVEAVAFINDHDVGMVCCDCRMPIMSGLEVLQALDKKLPFYLITGAIDIESELSGEPGVSGFLAKPLSPLKVADLAKAVLGKNT